MFASKFLKIKLSFYTFHGSIDKHAFYSIKLVIYYDKRLQASCLWTMQCFMQFKMLNIQIYYHYCVPYNHKVFIIIHKFSSFSLIRLVWYKRGDTLCWQVVREASTGHANRGLGGNLLPTGCDVGSEWGDRASGDSDLLADSAPGVHGNNDHLKIK